MTGSRSDPMEALRQWLAAEGYTPTTGVGTMAWRGRCAGRDITLSIVRRTRTVYFGEVRRTRLIGHTLGVSCSTTVHSRLVWWAPLRLVRAWPVRWLSRRRGLHVLEFPAALPPGRGLLTCEPAWAVQVVKSPALEAVAALLEETDARGCMGSLVLQPGRWDSTAALRPLAQITPSWVAQRIHTLVDLAAQVEALPAPREPAVTTALERWTQAHSVLLAVGLLISLILVLGITMLGLVTALVWLLH